MLASIKSTDGAKFPIAEPIAPSGPLLETGEVEDVEEVGSVGNVGEVGEFVIVGGFELVGETIGSESLDSEGFGVGDLDVVG